MGIANLPSILILIVSQGDSSGGQGPSGAVCKHQKTFGASVVNIYIVCTHAHFVCHLFKTYV